jgi:hypothetical protein
VVGGDLARCRSALWRGSFAQGGDLGGSQSGMPLPVGVLAPAEVHTVLGIEPPVRTATPAPPQLSLRARRPVQPMDDLQNWGRAAVGFRLHVPTQFVKAAVRPSGPSAEAGVKVNLVQDQAAGCAIVGQISSPSGWTRTDWKLVPLTRGLFSPYSQTPVWERVGCRAR